MTYDTGEVFRFRRIGSRGLVVFERDGSLLRTNLLSKDLALTDINTALIGLLRHLRCRGIRFGFFSDTRGMDAGRGGRVAASTLIDLFDAILRTDKAEPDFWMAMPRPEQTCRADKQHAHQIASNTFMLQRTMEWYGVDRKEVLFVGRSQAGTAAANMVGVATVPFVAASSLTLDCATHLPEIQNVENIATLILNREFSRPPM